MQGRPPAPAVAGWRRRLQAAGLVGMHDIHGGQVGRQVGQRCSGAVAVQLRDAHIRLEAHPASASFQCKWRGRLQG